MSDRIVNEELSGTTNEPVFKYFAYSHLKGELQEMSKKFFTLAYEVVREVDEGPERTVALRKLLEAKDAAVRAKMNPGG